jgi:hypothetical protein
MGIIRSCGLDGTSLDQIRNEHHSPLRRPGSGPSAIEKR